MKTKAVIFDLDGTLYDSTHLPFHVVLHNLFFLRMLWAERTTRAHISGRYYGSKGGTYREIFRRMAALTHRSDAAATHWYWNHYMPRQVKTLQRHMTAKSWVKPTLESLKAQGVKIVCFSDYSFIREKLKAIDIDPDIFDLLIDAPTAGGCKPCRKAFIYVAAKIDVYPSEILVVGDREDTDGAGAESANMRFQLVSKKDDPNFKLCI